MEIRLNSELTKVKRPSTMYIELAKILKIYPRGGQQLLSPYSLKKSLINHVMGVMGFMPKYTTL